MTIDCNKNVEAGFAAAPLLACIFCFMFGMIVIGPMVAQWWMNRQSLRSSLSDELCRPRVEHIPKLSERRKELVVYLLTQCRVCLSLALLKVKLLLQQALLKAVSQPARKPRTEQCAESNAAGASKESFVCHRDVRTQANESR